MNANMNNNYGDDNGNKKGGLPKSNVVHQIEQMEKKREERRKEMDRLKMEKDQKQ